METSLYNARDKYVFRLVHAEVKSACKIAAHILLSGSGDVFYSEKKNNISTYRPRWCVYNARVTSVHLLLERSSLIRAPGLFTDR
jgi:hypothetical protein